MEQVPYVLPGAVSTYSAKSALFTAGYADRGTFFESTGTFDITLSTTSMSAGWSAWFRTVSGTQTFDPSGAVTINGASTYAVSNAGDVVLVVFDGTNFQVSHTQRPSTVAITGGTINGTAIGGTTPAAAAFTTLTANGAATLTAGTASSSTTTGTLVITGGLGISNKIFVGAGMDVTGAASSDNIARITDAGTTNRPFTFVFSHQTSGTPAAGFGNSFVLRAHSTTNTVRNQGVIDSRWVDPTDASRTGRMALFASDATTDREGVRIEADGSAVKLGFFATAAAAQQASGANLTNSVATGGTNDTIANYTDLTTYANDSNAIRNNIYQLARKLKQVNDALRLYGLLT